MACSDDQGAIEYLAKLDRQVRNLDVIDDFASERMEVLARNPSAAYTFGGHIVKTLIGALDPTVVKLDESKSASCCALI
jgi:hypothetical protein